MPITGTKAKRKSHIFVLRLRTINTRPARINKPSPCNFERAANPNNSPNTTNCPNPTKCLLSGCPIRDNMTRVRELNAVTKESLENEAEIKRN